MTTSIDDGQNTDMLHRPLTNQQLDAAVTRACMSLNEDSSAANYANLYELFSSMTDNGTIESTKRVRVALVSSFTIDPLKPYFYFACAREGLFPQFYVAGFNQYTQDILNPDSELYRFQPELTVLALHAEGLLMPLLEQPFTRSFIQKEEILEAALGELCTLARQFSQHSAGVLLIHNLLVPSRSMYGVLDNKVEGGQAALVRAFNQRLAERLAPHRQMYVFDFEGIASEFGKSHCRDMKMWYLAQMYLSETFLSHLAGAYLRYIKPLKRCNRKCLVLDLDNTLWGGIIGEDGIDGIQLDPTPPGNAYRDFQVYIKSLSERGIILAVNSKNNFDDAIEVIHDHPYMVLREDNFACLKINWQDKITNLREIAEELNIGLDSIVFVDDNPAERLFVREHLPEVLTVELPPDPALYRGCLEGLTDFDTLTLTEEDWQRGRMYVDDRKRNELRCTAPSLEDFLRNLDMQVEVKTANGFAVPRIAQLTQRTNQFNLTTRRYSEGQIQTFCDSEHYKVYGLSVKDRFGDNGIVAAAIVEQDANVWRIDTLLMSCRVVGRQVEKTLLTKIVRDAHAAGIQRLRGEYVPTAKNGLVKDFYAQMGFQQREGGQWWGEVSTLQLEYSECLQVCED